MSDQTPAGRFVEALHSLDSSGETDAMGPLFAEGAELLRPEVDKKGSSGQDPDRFWSDYRSQFSEVRTEFTTVHECGELAALEWSSRGKLSTGRSIEYAGVSLLTLDGDGRITRFATYYDSAAFLEPADRA